jgi:ribonuclease HI
MNDPTPHYVLVSETSRTEGIGRWRFVLHPANGANCMEVADTEPDLWGERLDLLTVVRALESLDQPSKVTLIGCSRYVEQGILYGIQEWKESDWRWEWFGHMVPVRDIDLWQRMDRVLEFHQVDCRQRRLDVEHGLLKGPHWKTVAKESKKWAGSVAWINWVKYCSPFVVALCRLCGGQKLGARG